jgi:acetyl-CoA carboxylase biotin carboxyl carrier protein
MAKKSKPEKSASPKTSNVDLAEVERLLDFMQKHALQEFEYEREGVRIFLKKAGQQPAEALRNPALPEFASSSEAAIVTEALANAASPVTSEKPTGNIAVPDDTHIVKSPIVGTFYGSPSPEAEPFVAIGATVKAGQVLCIVEAMKLMNEIESDVAGEVVQVFVENGHPVEYGESLFEIRPKGKK